MTNGILPSQEIKDMIANKLINSKLPIEKSQIGGASLDMRLEGPCYNVPASILPGPHRSLTEFLSDPKNSRYELDLKKPRFLHTKEVFLALIMENLNLPKGYIAEATGKSTVARLDTIVRLMTDNATSFNQIPDGYKGKLWIEIIPNSIPIFVKEGDSMGQIKFAYKDFNQLDAAEIKRLQIGEGLIFNRNGNKIPVDELNIDESGAITLNAYLKKQSKIYIARQDIQKGILISDISKHYKKNKLEKELYFEEKIIDGSQSYNAIPGRFSILATKERVAVPSNFVVKMLPYSEGIGDFKPQEADLFNPGHGYIPEKERSEENLPGFCPMLEVKVNNIPLVIEHGRPICKIVYQRIRKNKDSSKAYHGSYSRQQEAHPGKWFG